MSAPPSAFPIRFFRGPHLYQIAASYDGNGANVIGIHDERIVAQGEYRSEVARALIMGGSELRLAGVEKPAP